MSVSISAYDLGKVDSYAFQVQQAIGQYTMVAQQKAKIMEGRMRPRSKDPPITSCTVQAQKSIWYRPSSVSVHAQLRIERDVQNTISGRNDEPGDGADMTFFRPKLAILPIKGLAVRE